MGDLSHDVRLSCGHEEAIERVTAALAAEGFGILSRIDIHEKFHDTLGLDFRPYTILGACNPALANLALGAAPEIGLLLPCNVTVEQTGAEVLVRIINAQSMIETAGYADNSVIAPVGHAADARLERVAAALAL